MWMFPRARQCNLPRLPQAPTSLNRRKISITHRGKAIGQEELYQYSNGRFLLDEAAQFRKRRMCFDVTQLCDVVGSIGKTKSPVTSIEKMEGGSSKALLLTRQDGTELVAKLPSPEAGLEHYSTASEVAVLKYLKSQTTIPVPEVFAWSSDSSNPTGCEYIIMEKATGVPLGKVWDDLNQVDKLGIVKEMNELQNQLASITFPALGHLYLRDFASTNKDLHNVLPPTVDPAQAFCIGMSCSRSWFTKKDIVQQTFRPLQGPWPSVYAYGIALARRESLRINDIARTASYTGTQRTSEVQLSLLQKVVKLLQMWEKEDALGHLDESTLWHTDLHLGNIYISEDKPSKISCIIDWEDVAVLPQFLQVDWPEFVKPLEGYEEGFKKPPRPNLELLSAEEKELAISRWKELWATKAYETSCYLWNKKAHDARTLPAVFKYLFLGCGNISKEGAGPLGHCLIDIAYFWDTLGLPGQCPYSFSEDDIEAVDAELTKYRERQKIHTFAQTYLGTDADGWLSPDDDFEEMLKNNKVLFEWLVWMDAGERSREALKELWPFSNHL